MADLMLLLKQDLRGDAPGLAGDTLRPWPPVCNSDKTSVCVLHTRPEYARLIEAATRRFVVVTQKPEQNTVPKLETSNTRRGNGKRRHSPGPSPGAPANARRGKLETVADFISFGSKITVDGDCGHETKTPAPWKETCDKPTQHVKKQRHHFANKGPYSQSYGFSSSHVWM